ncbi:spondin domain-containing protein [Accumulibacter sp.]|uniref:spondin domain-containing protein n=1 Tax=Accumulibacter sp. TaxID=2053492 RepID=UPI0028C473E8|nr:spondin domain-containing protein [Accumulibacter sp.]
MHERQFTPFRLVAATAALAFCATAGAAQVRIAVSIENLAPTNSISFAPLHVGFNNGTFDAFDNGATASNAIISVAELGGGTEWQTAFAAADPTATRGAIGGALLPGQSNSATFLVDTSSNPFFTFAAMALPSNDSFIGNDSPTQYRLFDATGNLLIASILQKASDIWDAGSELFDPANAAFLGDATLRTPENGVVGFDFAGLAGFNGLTTAAGYVFNSALAADSDVYRISFQVVPEPETFALMLPGLLAIGWVGRRRRSQSAESALSPG